MAHNHKQTQFDLNFENKIDNFLWMLLA